MSETPTNQPKEGENTAPINREAQIPVLKGFSDALGAILTVPSARPELIKMGLKVPTAEEVLAKLVQQLSDLKNNVTAAENKVARGEPLRTVTESTLYPAIDFIKTNYSVRASAIQEQPQTDSQG